MWTRPKHNAEERARLAAGTRYKVTDESNHNGPCFVTRREYRPGEWEWVSWSKTRKDAESVIPPEGRE